MNAENSNNGKTGTDKMVSPGAAEIKAQDQKQDQKMGAAYKADDKPAGQAAAPKQPLTAAIRERWTKFADGDLDDVRTREQLATAVQSKYGITADQATTQVSEWAVGRQF